MAMLNLVAPWIEFYREVEAMFKKDPEVTVIFDQDNYKLQVYVDREDKAKAIEYLLLPEEYFGEIHLTVEVIPANDYKPLRSINFSNMDLVNIFHSAFMGNRAFGGAEEWKLGGFHRTYVVFEKEVVQYFNDSLGDIHGIRSTLYQEIAKDIFKEFEDVSYCTAKVPLPEYSMMPQDCL